MLEIAGTLYLLLPLLGGALVHGLCMKYDWLAFLKRPIDGGRKWRGEPLFGHSKTWRGPVLVAAGSAAVFALQQQLLHGLALFQRVELVDYAGLPGAWFAAVAGAAAELSELPNSFTKRRLRISPGGTTRGALGALFFGWDQVDLLLGFWLVFGFAVPVSMERVAISLVLLGALHPLVTLIGYLAGMRTSAR
jgi:CDP-archaeol synthase